MTPVLKRLGTRREVELTVTYYLCQMQYHWAEGKADERDFSVMPTVSRDLLQWSGRYDDDDDET